MMLFAAIAPPRDSLESVAVAVGPALATQRASPVMVPPPKKRRLWNRGSDLGGDAAGEPPEPEPPVLVVRPLGAVQLTVTRFGNMTPAEAVRLTSALRVASAGWPDPLLHFEGGKVVESSRGRRIGALIEGDSEGLFTLANEVRRAAQRVGYLLDRRDFVPVVPLIDVPAGTTTAQVDKVLEALDGFSGDTWPAALLRIVQDPFQPDADPKEYTSIPLGLG